VRDTAGGVVAVSNAGDVDQAWLDTNDVDMAADPFPESAPTKPTKAVSAAVFEGNGCRDVVGETAPAAGDAPLPPVAETTENLSLDPASKPEEWGPVDSSASAPAEVVCDTSASSSTPAAAMATGAVTAGAVATALVATSSPADLGGPEECSAAGEKSVVVVDNSPAAMKVDENVADAAANSAVVLDNEPSESETPVSSSLHAVSQGYVSTDTESDASVPRDQSAESLPMPAAGDVRAAAPVSAEALDLQTGEAKLRRDQDAPPSTAAYVTMLKSESSSGEEILQNASVSTGYPEHVSATPNEEAATTVPAHVPTGEFAAAAVAGSAAFAAVAASPTSGEVAEDIFEEYDPEEAPPAAAPLLTHRVRGWWPPSPLHRKTVKTPPVSPLRLAVSEEVPRAPEDSPAAEAPPASDPPAREEPTSEDVSLVAGEAPTGVEPTSAEEPLAGEDPAALTVTPSGAIPETTATVAVGTSGMSNTDDVIPPAAEESSENRDIGDVDRSETLAGAAEEFVPSAADLSSSSHMPTGSNALSSFPRQVEQNSTAAPPSAAAAAAAFAAAAVPVEALPIVLAAKSESATPNISAPEIPVPAPWPMPSYRARSWWPPNPVLSLDAERAALEAHAEERAAKGLPTFPLCIVHAPELSPSDVVAGNARTLRESKVERTAPYRTSGPYTRGWWPPSPIPRRTVKTPTLSPQRVSLSQGSQDSSSPVTVDSIAAIGADENSRGVFVPSSEPITDCDSVYVPGGLSGTCATATTSSSNDPTGTSFPVAPPPPPPAPSASTSTELAPLSAVSRAEDDVGSAGDKLGPATTGNAIEDLSTRSRASSAAAVASAATVPAATVLAMLAAARQRHSVPNTVPQSDETQEPGVTASGGGDRDIESKIEEPGVDTSRTLRPSSAAPFVPSMLPTSAAPPPPPLPPASAAREVVGHRSSTIPLPPPPPFSRPRMAGQVSSSTVPPPPPTTSSTLPVAPPPPISHSGALDTASSRVPPPPPPSGGSGGIGSTASLSEAQASGRRGDDFDVDVDMELTEDISENETDVDSTALVASHLQEHEKEMSQGLTSEMDRVELKDKLLEEQQRQERIEIEQTRISELRGMKRSFVPNTSETASAYEDVGLVARRMDSRGNFVTVCPDERSEFDDAKDMAEVDAAANRGVTDGDARRVSVAHDPFYLEKDALAPPESFPPDSRFGSEDSKAESDRARAIREGREKRRLSGHHSFIGYDIDDEGTKDSGHSSSSMQAENENMSLGKIASRQASAENSAASEGGFNSSTQLGTKSLSSGGSRSGSGSGSGDGSAQQVRTEYGIPRSTAYADAASRTSSGYSDSRGRTQREGHSARRLLFSRPSGPSKEVAEVKDSIKKMVKRYRPSTSGTESSSLPHHGASHESASSRSLGVRRFVSGHSQSPGQGVQSPYSAGSNSVYSSETTQLSPKQQALADWTGPTQSQSTYAGVAAYSGLPSLGSARGTTEPPFPDTPSVTADSQPDLLYRASYGGSPQGAPPQQSIYSSAPQVSASPPLYARSGQSTSPFANNPRTLSAPIPPPQAVSLTQFVSNYSVGRTSTYVGRLLTEIGCTVAVKKNNNKMKVEAPYGVGSQVLHASISMEPMGAGPSAPGMPMVEERTMVTVMRSKEDRGRTEVHEFVSFYHLLRERFEEMNLY
jgi:hypothetical protein